MHIEKYNRNAIGHMLEHYERNPKIYKTQEHINPELTKLNYTLGNDELTGMAKYKKILATPGLKVLNRADVNTMVDVVLTLPKAEYFPQERAKEFFEVGYKFLLNKFCNDKEDFLISCYAHLDESQDGVVKGQPHIHFSFVPVFEQNGKQKVCAQQNLLQEQCCELCTKMQATILKITSDLMLVFSTVIQKKVILQYHNYASKQRNIINSSKSILNYKMTTSN